MPPFGYYFYLDTNVAADCTLRWKNGTVPELVVYIKPFAGSRDFEIKFLPYVGDFPQNNASLWHSFVIPTITVRILVSPY